MGTGTLSSELRALHAETGSWRDVGEALGKSGAYAQRVARGTLKPSREALTNWQRWKGQRKYKDLFDMPVAELAAAIRNRVEYRGGE